MTEREAFVAAIAANPAEDTPRLAFADWLQENGEDDRAAFVRLACEVAAHPRGLNGPTWPEDVRELFYRASELLKFRGPFWLEAFYRALGCEETNPSPPRGWAGRLWERAVGEPRTAYHALEYNGGNPFVFRIGGNNPVREIGLRRGFVERLDIGFGSPFAIPDLATAFRLEPVHRLFFHFTPNTKLWRSLDVGCLSRVSHLGMCLPGTLTRRDFATFADLAHGENWSGLMELHVWHWRSHIDDIAMPHEFVRRLANAPLLSRLSSLMIDVSPADLPLLMSSPHARNLRSLGMSWVRLPAEACDALASATFRPNLEALYLTLSEPDDGARRLAAATWPKLRTLHMGHDGFSDLGARNLLPLVPQLTTLGLYGGQITDAGARLLADAVNPEALDYLSLSYNPLSEGMVAELRERFGDRFQFTARDGPLQQFA